MALMEFLHENLINTTTQFKVDSNTGSVQNLFDKNISKKYNTSGYNSDTSTNISIEFGSATVIDHIILQNHNLKGFRAYYNSVTANSLFTVTQNSATSTYHSFNAVTVTSLQLQVDTTQAGSTEKSIGEFMATRRDVVAFERNPSIENFDPTISRKQIRIEMPDGGIQLYNIKDKYKAKLKFKYITESFRDNLLSVYNTALPFIFVPFPTTTGWSGSASEVVWTGPFDFNYSDNAKSQGYDGQIILEQTPSA